MGAQDDLEQARGFVADTGTEAVAMLWDPSFDSWRHFGITRQPAAVLTDAAGNPLATWSGMFDEAEVLELAGAG